MLRFEHRRASVGVLPVFELLLIIKRENVFYQQTLGPGINEASALSVMYE